MPHNADRRLLLAGLGAAGALAITRTARAATCGDAGPLGPTGPTTRDLYDHVARGGAAGFGDSRTPIQSLTPSATGQYQITQSGVYNLTDNITGVAGMACIEVLADQVEIQCDGYVFIGVPGAGRCITTPSPRRCICIYDASFRNWPNTCIDFRNSSDCLCEESWFDTCDGAGPTGTGPGICVLGPHGFLYDLDAYDCHGSLMWVGIYGAIEECMSVGGVGGCFKGDDATVIENCFALSNSGAGITVASRSTVTLCRVVDNGGIVLGGQSVAFDNEVSGASGAAITVMGPDGEVEDNYISGSPSGIDVLAGGGGTLVDLNHVVGASSGIYVDGGAPKCLVIRNQVQGGGAASTPYSIAAGSSYGSIVSVVGVGDIGALAPDAWTNFVY